MISLILGLGGELFSALTTLSFLLASVIKIGMFALAFLWSCHLAVKIIHAALPDKSLPYTVFLPGLCGTLFVAVIWWPSLF